MKKELTSLKEVKKAVDAGEKVIYDFFTQDPVYKQGKKYMTSTPLGDEFELTKPEFQNSLGKYYSITE